MTCRRSLRRLTACCKTTLKNNKPPAAARMGALVERMPDLHHRHAAGAGSWRPNPQVVPTVPDWPAPLQRQIDATDQQIDALVYELYGLTDEEIAIVEGL